MVRTNTELKEAALTAISEYHSNSDVPLETTVEVLEELRDKCEELAQACREDIRNRDG